MPLSEICSTITDMRRMAAIPSFVEGSRSGNEMSWDAVAAREMIGMLRRLDTKGTCNEGSFGTDGRRKFCNEPRRSSGARGSCSEYIGTEINLKG